MKQGFTLIELLTVVVVIGILMSIGFASYSNAQEKARDSKRKQELDNIKKALELAKQDTPGAYSYPSCSSNPSCGASTTAPQIAPTYISKVPTDPKTDIDYPYMPATSSNGVCDNATSLCTKYLLIACLENGRDPQKDPVENETVCPGAPVSYTVKPN